MKQMLWQKNQRETSPQKREKLSRSTGSPVNTCKSTSLGLQIIIHFNGVKCALRSTGSTKEVWRWRVEYIRLKRSQQICNSSKWIHVIVHRWFSWLIFNLNFLCFPPNWHPHLMGWYSQSLYNGSDSVEPKNRNITKQSWALPLTKCFLAVPEVGLNGILFSFALRGSIT